MRAETASPKAPQNKIARPRARDPPLTQSSLPPSLLALLRQEKRREGREGRGKQGEKSEERGTLENVEAINKERHL